MAAKKTTAEEPEADQSKAPTTFTLDRAVQVNVGTKAKPVEVIAPAGTYELRDDHRWPVDPNARVMQTRFAERLQEAAKKDDSPKASAPGKTTTTA